MSQTPIEQFLLEIDVLWDGGVVAGPIRVIGSAALMLQVAYQRGTKDSDVLGVDPVIGTVKEKLLALAGKGTRIHQKHQVYLDVVSPGLPFLPRSPRYHDLEGLNARLRFFRVSVLDVVDTVVSKLARFSSSDIDDIRAMVDLGLIVQSALVERFGSAMDWYLMDARADDLPRYVRNLNRVEREFLMVAPTTIEFPDWLDAE